MKNQWKIAVTISLFICIGAFFDLGVSYYYYRHIDSEYFMEFEANRYVANCFNNSTVPILFLMKIPLMTALTFLGTFLFTNMNYSLDKARTFVVTYSLGKKCIKYGLTFFFMYMLMFGLQSFFGGLSWYDGSTDIASTMYLIINLQGIIVFTGFFAMFSGSILVLTDYELIKRGYKNMSYKTINIEELKPLEKVFPNHLKHLKEMIFRDDMIKYPLIIDEKYNIVLDGSHRYIILMEAGYQKVPVIPVDYDNPHIRVGTHRMHRLLVHGDTKISKEEVVERGRSGNLYPPRTTRHFFPFLRPEINVSLRKLHKDKPRNMNEFIANVTVKEEIKHNKKYIEEIDEEEIELKNYLEECSRTRDYLKQQIKEMKR